MPVITFNYKDFCKLVGRKFSLKELEATMPMMGLEWEGREGDEVGVEVFPNRPDLLSVEGLARAYASFRGLKPGLINFDLNDSTYELLIDESVRKIRPFISAAVVKGVDLSDEGVKSLMQLQEKLHLTHCRNRKKAAIGVHDLRAVKFPVKYSAVEPDAVSFIPLDSTKEMTPEDVLVEHAKGIKFAGLLEGFNKYPLVSGVDKAILSFPPIINSELTKVRSNTKDLFIEVTGTDLGLVDKALNIVVTSLLARGAKAYKVKLHRGRDVFESPSFEPIVFDLTGDYVRQLLGELIPDRSIPVLLRRMGFGVSREKNLLSVKVPCYRTDVMHPMDLVEDVAIAFGYENFKPVQPRVYGVGSEKPLHSRVNYLKDLLVGFGFIEVYNWLLTSEDVLFNNLGREPGGVVEVLHPKTEGLTVCRDLVIPQLIELLGDNKHNDYPQQVFEVNDVLRLAGDGFEQESHLGLAVANSSSNYSALKAVVDVISKDLSVDLVVKPCSKEFLIDGRAAELFLGEQSVGFIGEVHPRVLEAYDLKVPVTVCELNVDLLLE